MRVEELKKNLDKNLHDFSAEIRFEVETFNQNHDSEFLTKYHMEEMSKQTFYVMGNFRDSVVKYLESQENEKDKCCRNCKKKG